MKLLLELPLNSLSFGNVSINILRELHKKNIEIGLFPTGDINVDSFELTEDFKKYLEDPSCIDRSWLDYFNSINFSLYT